MSAETLRLLQAQAESEHWDLLQDPLISREFMQRLAMYAAERPDDPVLVAYRAVAKQLRLDLVSTHARPSELKH